MSEFHSDIEWESDGDNDDESERDDGTICISLGNNSGDEEKLSTTSIKTPQSKTLKRPRLNIDDESNQLAITRHEEDLLTGLEYLKSLAKQTTDELLNCLLQAYLPNHTSSSSSSSCNMISSTCDRAPIHAQSLSELHGAINDFRQLGFRTTTSTKYRRKLESLEVSGHTNNILVEYVLENQLGTSIHIQQILMAYLTLLGFETRLVGCLSPCSFKPHRHIDIVKKQRKRQSNQLRTQEHLKSCSKISNISTKKRRGTASSSTKASNIVNMNNITQAGNNTREKPDVIAIDEDDDNVDIPEVHDDDDDDDGEGVGDKSKLISSVWLEIYLSMPTSSSSSSSSSSSPSSSSSDSLRGGSNRSHSNNNHHSNHVCRWVHVDYINKLIDQPLSLCTSSNSSSSSGLNPSQKYRSLAYVTSVDGRGRYAIDVTPRYCTQYHYICSQYRLPASNATNKSHTRGSGGSGFESDWWSDVLSSHCQTDTSDSIYCNNNSSSNSSSSSSNSSIGNNNSIARYPEVIDVELLTDPSSTHLIHYQQQLQHTTSMMIMNRILAEEQQELFQLIVSQTALPTNVAAFRNHPVYVLERHMTQNQILLSSRAVVSTSDAKSERTSRISSSSSSSSSSTSKLGAVIVESVDDNNGSSSNKSSTANIDTEKESNSINVIQTESKTATTNNTTNTSTTTTTTTTTPSTERRRQKRPISLVHAYFKGERVYLRSNIHTLYSRRDWYKRLRVVRPECLMTPCKTLTKQMPSRNAGNYSSSSFYNNKNNNNDDDDDDDENGKNSESKNNKNEILLKLYSYDQTSLLFIPAVSQDGIIPTNSHGNVEVWQGDPRLVPQGAVLVTHSDAVKIATQLGIYHAPALFGFEEKTRYNSNNNDSSSSLTYKVPKIGGVVILNQDEALLLEAMNNIDQYKQNEKRKKQQIINLERWKRLIVSVCTRHRLKVTYGH